MPIFDSKAERNQKILERHNSGATYSEIAREFGMSGEAVRKICILAKRRALTDPRAPEWSRKFFNLLSTRAKNVIFDDPDIAEKTYDEALLARNAGVKTINEIRDLLRLHNVQTVLAGNVVIDPARQKNRRIVCEISGELFEEVRRFGNLRGKYVFEAIPDLLQLGINGFRDK